MPTVFREGNVKWNKCLNINRRYAVLECKYYSFHDSFKLLPMSLKKASEQFNLEHGKLDLWEEVQKEYPGQYKNVVDFLSNCDVDNELYLKYLGYDVISLYELIEKLIDVSSIPLEKLVKCPSTASMSKYIFKHGYKGQPFYSEEETKTDYDYLISNKYWLSDKPIKNTNVSWQEIELKCREAYYGGRTEVFTPKINETGKEINAFYYDVNSLYPYACKENFYPVGVPQFYDDAFSVKYKWNLWLRKKRGLGFLKCKVFVPQQKIPPLPTRKERLCFLTGYLEGYWTFVELEYAIKNCGVEILEFIEMVYFPKTFKIYANYIDVFNTMKEQATKDGNMALREFSKLMNNTSYGWTAMKRQQLSLDDIKNYEKHRNKGKLITINKELGYCQYEDRARSESIQVQVGAYVTSYARLILLEGLRRQAEKGEIYYCDTDSIVCEAEMDSQFVDDVKLGYFGLENVIKKGLFLFPKVYTIETAKTTKYKFKGVTKERQQTFNYKFYEDIYKSLCAGDTGRIPIEENITRLRGLVTAQKNELDPNELVYSHKDLLLDNMQKRNIDYKNNKSVAWHMENIEMFNDFSFVKRTWEGEFFEKRR